MSGTRQLPDGASRVFARPSSRSGTYAVLLLGAFLLFMMLFGVALWAGLGPERADEFFDNLYLALPLLFAAASAVIGAGFAAFAMIARDERSALVMIVLACGILVGLFALGELAGDDPGAGAALLPTIG